MFHSSFDTRQSKFEKGTHWYDESSLGNRAFFEAATYPASLAIRNISNADSGTYRCRVDFHKSPTRNSRVQLSVISEYMLHLFHKIFYSGTVITRKYY